MIAQWQIIRLYSDDIKMEGQKPIPKPIPEVKRQNEGTKLLLPLVLELVLSLHFFMSSKWGLIYISRQKYFERCCEMLSFGFEIHFNHQIIDALIIR